MASEQHGPAAQNMLEPPGFALHYGVQTPLAPIVLLWIGAFIRDRSIFF